MNGEVNEGMVLKVEGVLIEGVSVDQLVEIIDFKWPERVYNGTNVTNRGVSETKETKTRARKNG